MANGKKCTQAFFNWLNHSEIKGNWMDTFKTEKAFWTDIKNGIFDQTAHINEKIQLITIHISSQR